MSPILSLVVCAFNEEENINRCINSILESTKLLDNKNEIEIIIIDDGSTDSTRDILNNIKERKIDILKIIFNHHQGLSQSRNLGVDNSNSKFVLFTDFKFFSSK